MVFMQNQRYLSVYIEDLLSDISAMKFSVKGNMSKIQLLSDESPTWSEVDLFSDSNQKKYLKIIFIYDAMIRILGIYRQYLFSTFCDRTKQ